MQGCCSYYLILSNTGYDRIEVEHLLYAHPILVVILCNLFNIMLLHGVVPTMFGMGVIVPLTWRSSFLLLCLVLPLLQLLLLSLSLLCFYGHLLSEIKFD